MTGITLLTLAIATAAVNNPAPAAPETLPADQKAMSTSSWDPDDHSIAGAIGGGALATAVVVAVPIILSATVGLQRWGTSSLLGNAEHDTTDGQRLGTGLLLGGFVTLVPLSTWAGHRLGGGTGSFAAAFVGGALGSLAATALALTVQQDHSGTLGQNISAGVSSAVMLALAAGLPLTGSVFAIQSAHARKWIPQLNVSPARGGATLSMGWNL